MSYQSYDETLDQLLISADADTDTRPVNLVRKEDLEALPDAHRAWLDAVGFTAGAGSVVTLPGSDGKIEGAVMGKGKRDGEWSALLPGALPQALPKGAYHLAGEVGNAEQVALAWLLGSYVFERYKGGDTRQPRSLKVPAGIDANRVRHLARAVYFGRDLINTPASDLGPAELELAARELADTHGAEIDVTTGDALIDQNFPMIHAVGRASDREPRLIDIRWGDTGAPKVTLVGKGICFDTGGLNLKPGNSMALMKKDMGGAAAVLALASMIMSAGLKVRLRVLVPAAENNVSANAFRPSDVLHSRNGMTVEIGNTDAEGRLVLADALSLADEETPDYLVSMATLTGAARVALGPDLPPFYSDDDTFAGDVLESASSVADHLWRMPFWMPYDKTLKSGVADVNHISDGPFAGSVTAALFLKRFVSKAERYAHLDIYGWTPSAKPGRPKGGEPQGARALFDTFLRTFGT